MGSRPKSLLPRLECRATRVGIEQRGDAIPSSDVITDALPAFARALRSAARCTSLAVGS
jgi:hypothetical protein